MTKLTSLPIILLTLANITPALTVFIPNFLNYTNSVNINYTNSTNINYTNSTNITYHIPPHPAPSPSGTLPSNISTLQTPDKNDLVWVPPSSPTFYRGNRLYEDEVCGASSFTGITRATSPLTQDCLALADDAAKERYVWYAKGFVDNTTILGIRSHGTCTFGIKPPYANALPRIMTGWYVGGVDVAEVIRTAVRDYDVAGQVGASGMMYCWANRQNHVDVQWAIYGASEQAEAGYFWAPPVPANSGAGKGGIVSTGVITGVLVFWLLLFWNIVNCEL